MKIAIIGAGAAGCFCAVNLKRLMPEADVVVYEKGSKVLAKVAITGGGRCNLTNSFRDVKSVQSVYPRGDKLMKRALKVFSHEDTMRWFEAEGVRLVTQDDQCVFPQSQDAMEIVMTLTRLMQNLGVRLRLGKKVSSLGTPLYPPSGGKNKNETEYWVLEIEQPSPLRGDRGGSGGAGRSKVSEESELFDAVVVTTGGSPRESGLSFLDPLHLEIVNPVPSLFTFNVKDDALHGLMGTVVNDVCCRLIGTKLQSSGPLLITHWGLSGPAILKLSSYGARVLAERDYKADVSINWFGEDRESDVLEMLQDIQRNNGKKQLSSVYPDRLVNRHWLYMIQKTGLSPTKRWQEVGTKQMNRLASLLTNDVYHVDGRGTFKDEFVTCGGVSLSNININTLESKQYPGLYFAGEVLDVDAVTGGFNLQAAWTMGWIVAQSISSIQSEK